MRFLGVVYGHDATLCLVENGEVTFCQSEERLNRIKNSVGFPRLTLRYLYDHIAAPGTIDLAVLYERDFHLEYLRLKHLGFPETQPGFNVDSDLLEDDKESLFLRFVKDSVLRTGFGKYLRNRKIAHASTESKILQDEALKYFSDSLQLPQAKVCALDHHLAHAYSTLPNIQEWGETLVLTLDGWGDGLCATVNIYQEGNVKRISASKDIHSLGTYYRLTTSILGMRGLGDEYKVMGLAAYAQPSQYEALTSELMSLLRINDEGQWESTCSGRKLRAELERIYRFKRFDHIAGAIQHVSERLVLEWVRFWVKRTGCRNLALAGGVFMNVKVSQAIAGADLVRRLFVMPSAGDESNAIGCAIWAAMTKDSPTPVKPLKSLYLGMEFNASDIDTAIAETEASSRYRIAKLENANCEIGKLLASNKIVARCSGRMEFGARALGNRSILANPTDPLNVKRINEAIKSRDFWMPFAPSILAEEMARYVKDCETIFAPYMCIAFHSTPEAQRELCAAIHPRDLTLRPQAVTKEWNPDYYEIIKSFKDRTGVGGVLNTSFNLHGEPIVCSPGDAIRASDRSGLNYLVLGNSLLTKRTELS